MAEKIEKRTDEELVLFARKGDNEGMEALLRKYSGLVRSCARQYFLIGGEPEDLVQEGMIGLYRAVMDYDGEREQGRSFKNFAYLCISRQILDAIKRNTRKKRGAQYSVQPLDVEMVETGMGPEELLIVNDERQELRQKMSKVLSDFEFKVAIMYVDGMTSAEICEATGKPSKSVDNAIQRSKRKLLQVFSR